MTLDATTLDKIRSIGGERLLSKMIALFLESSPANVEKASEAVETGDLETYARSIHAVKSSAVNFGANRLAEMAASIETEARAGNPDALQDLDAFKAEYNKVTECLKQIRQES